MKKHIVILFALILCLPGLIFPDIVSFKVGYFIPRAMSDLWEIELENMSFTSTDFQNTNFVFGYEYFVSREFSLILSIDGYTKNKSGIYNDYIGEDIDGDVYAFDYGEGAPISHVFSVSSTPVQASVKFTPLGRKGKIIPFIGGGVGVYIWSVRVQGEMIDFYAGEEFIDLDLDEIVIGYPTYGVDAREENRFSFGYHAFVGFMIPIANRISLEAEVKYNRATGNFKNGFLGFDPFDLGGWTIGVGMNYWF